MTYVILRDIIIVGGAVMKKKDLEKKLRKAGWTIFSGTKHDMAQHNDFPGVKIPLPRHTEINEYTAKNILKDAGI